MTSVLQRCAAALRKDLGTPGPELLNSERIGALVVQLLLREIIPNQITAAGPLDFPDAAIEQDDLVSLLFSLAASASATHDRRSASADPGSPGRTTGRPSGWPSSSPASRSRRTKSHGSYKEASRNEFRARRTILDELHAGQPAQTCGSIEPGRSRPAS